MSLNLPDSLVKLLEAEAERRGSTPEALTVQLLLQIASEGERARILLEAAETIYSHAEAAAERGDYSTAFRKLWSSTLLAFDAYACLQGLRRPSSLHDYVKLAGEAGSENVVFMDALYAGIAALVFWREGFSFPSHYRRVSSHVKGLLEAVKSIAEAGGAAEGREG